MLWVVKGMSVSMLESDTELYDASLGKTGFAEEGFGLCQADALLKLVYMELHPK